MYIIRPALRHLEGRCLCTSQGSHPLSDSERADSSLPNNLRKGNHITYLSIKMNNTASSGNSLYYKITKLVPFFFPLLSYPTGSLQTRNPN